MKLPLLTATPYEIKGNNIRIGDGVNNGIPIFDIKDTEATEMSNLSSEQYPILSVRPPRSNYTYYLTGTIRHLGTRGQTFLTVVDGTIWKFWTGVAWAYILGGIAAANCNSVDFMTYTILVDGAKAWYFNGEAMAEISGFPITILPDFITVHANRLYSASKSNQNLCYSALRKYNDWTSAEDSGVQVVETKDGAGASGLIEFANHIVYFKEHSMHELYGTGYINYQVLTVSNSIGCISNRTIKEINGRLFWLGYEGVYMYSGGTLPTLVSYPKIQGYIDRLDKTNREKACAGTDGNKYYLCLPIDTGAKILLVYDTRILQWHVEDNIDVVEFALLNNILYGITSAGQITKMVDKTASETREWYWISKPFNLNTLEKFKSWYRLYFLADMANGSTLDVYLSNEAEGTNFKNVYSFTANNNIQNKKIEVPLTIAQNADYVRIKLAGTDTLANITKIYSMQQDIKMWR